MNIKVSKATSKVFDDINESKCRIKINWKQLFNKNMFNLNKDFAQTKKDFIITQSV